jgi:fibronectin-binding autotransporter adhesin
VALAGAATISTTSNSTAIGFSTNQTLKQGAWIYIDGAPYRLAAAVTATNTATLTSNYQGTTTSGRAGLVANGAWAVLEATVVAGPVTLAGDVTGNTAASVVSKVNGASVPSAGALTTGNAPYVSGVSSLGYSALNLGGGAGWVTGTLPAANQASQAMAGDVTGTTAASVVGKITGAAGVMAIAATGNVFTWAATTTAPGWAQTAPTSDVAPASMTIAPQGPFASAVTNVNPGNLVFSFAAPISGSPTAKTSWVTGGTEFFKIVPNGGTGSVQCTTPAQFNLTSLNNIALTSTSGGFVLSGSTFIFSSSGSTFATLNPGVTTQMLFGNAATTAVTFSQTAAASTSGGSGAAGVPMSITAQAGQAATGASNNGGAGAPLNLSSGAGGTSGSATAGVAGPVNIKCGGTTVAAFGNSGFQEAQTTQALTTGTTTLAAAVYQFGYIKFTGSLTGNVIVVLPANAGSQWLLDTTQITFNAHTITFQANSNSWGTVSSAGAVYSVVYNGNAGKLYGNTLTP